MKFERILLPKLSNVKLLEFPDWCNLTDYVLRSLSFLAQIPHLSSSILQKKEWVENTFQGQENSYIPTRNEILEM